VTNPFDFSARATRTQFNLFVLLYFVGYVVLTAMLQELLATATGIFLSVVGVLAAGVACFGMIIQRVRDIGWSQWTMAWTFVPLLGVIYFLALMVTQTDAKRPAS
jgi:uncharacterized membrane protein YhaH (DUF805 family)